MKNEHQTLILFTFSFPFGNSEQFLETEIEYISSQFSKVLLVPYSYDSNMDSRALPDGVKCLTPLYNFSKFSYILKGIVNFSPITFAIKEFFCKKVYTNRKWIRSWLLSWLRIRWMLADKRLKATLSCNKDALLYFYWGTGIADIIPFLDNRKKIIRFHGADFYEESSLNNGYIPFRNKQLKSMDYGIFISKYGERYLREKYRDISFDAKIYPLGVKHIGKSMPETDGTLKIVTCSAMIPLKSIKTLVNALKSLQIAVTWTHFGDGPLKNDIQERIEKLPANIKCNLMGLVPNREILNYYKNNPVDLFINTSLEEGIPMSIMEALSAGIPVYATDTGAITELLDKKAGKRLPVGIKPEDLAKEIMGFYDLSKTSKLKLRDGAFNCWKNKADSEIKYSEFSKFLLDYSLQN